MNKLEERLVALRPEPSFTDDEARELLDRVLGTERVARRSDVRVMVERLHRRRRIAVATAVLAAAAVAVALPVALPSGAPGGAASATAAAQLRLLADLAGGMPPPQPIRADQFMHMILDSHQQSIQGRSELRVESWDAPSGASWSHRTFVFNGRTLEDGFEKSSANGTFDSPTPQFLASLPTEPGRLDAHLRAHLTGYSSQDGAVFEEIGNLLRWGYAPPKLRAAAVEVLARTPHVTLGPRSRDPFGRTVQEFDFTDPNGVVTGMSFDVRTVQIVDELTKASHLHYVETITSDVVDNVPASVRAKAVVQK